MNVIIHPSTLSGEVVAPSSKSEAHRDLICAAFAPGTTFVECSSTSADIDATISCLEALGAHISRIRDGFRVRPVPGSSATDNLPDPTREALLDCGESGSTLRFLLPVACALGCGASFLGHGRLPERPLSPLYERLVENGARLSDPGSNPLEVKGRIRAGRYELPGNVSSQYVSGLLLAAPLLRAPVEVVVTEPVESRPYIDLTISSLRRFGVEVSSSHGNDSVGQPALVYDVSAPRGFASPGELVVGGDWSNAAFWFAAGAIGGDGVAVTGLDPQSPQGDRAILAALSLLGAQVLRSTNGAAVRAGSPHGATLDVSNCPDLVPPLAAVAAVSEGTTRIVGASRLRLKESDRLATVSAALTALGAEVQIVEDGLVITGSPSLRGGTVDAANDHRIAMMAAILATRCEQPTKIIGAQCVDKSYPRFYDDLASLGGRVETE